MKEGVGVLDGVRGGGNDGDGGGDGGSGGAVVLCNFNRLHKIDPYTFGAWMEVRTLYFLFYFIFCLVRCIAQTAVNGYTYIRMDAYFFDLREPLLPTVCAPARRSSEQFLERCCGCWTAAKQPALTSGNRPDLQG